MERKLFAVSLAAVLLLSGCGSRSLAGGAVKDDMTAASVPSGDWGGGEWNGAFDMTEGMDSVPEEPAPPPEGEPAGGSIYQDARTKLIRRAELEIQTEQFDHSKEALDRLVDSCEGYFENASVYGGGRRDAYANRRGEYVVRIPAERYSQFLSGTGDLGYVNSRTESSEDVGEQYFDIEARLKTQRTKQERLLSLLEKAETMEDIILLEGALSDVEYQIEMCSSDLNRYDSLIGFSTIRIYINEVGRITEEVGETASLGQRMSAGVRASFQALDQGVQDLLVWASYNLFFLVILAAAAAAGIIIGTRYRKKLRNRSGTKPKEE